MPRLIDADALIEKYTVVIRKTADEKLKTEIAVLLEDIENTPTVDAVQVIRCKDCVSWRKSCFESVNEMVCNKTRYIMKADGYCSMAKPKEKK